MVKIDWNMNLKKLKIKYRHSYHFRLNLLLLLFLINEVISNTKESTTFLVLQSQNQTLFTLGITQIIDSPTKKHTMSRLDFFTIFVVAICILAIIFLIFKATQLANGDGISVPENTSSVADADDFDEDEDLYDSDGAEIVTDTNTDELGGSANSDEDGMTSAGEADTDNEDAEEEDTMGDLDEAEAETPVISREPEVISTEASLGKYLVIAGTFKIKSGAQTLARQLRNAGYSNAKSSIFDRGTYAIVLVDRFDSQSEANALASKLKSSGIEAYVQAVRGSSN
ncbi:MAG: cell division septation protein DedD [Paraglaciecola sp.]